MKQPLRRPVISNRIEDDLLAAIRDIHVQVVALFERRDLCDWLLSDPDPDNEGFLRTIEQLRDAERLFYHLRAERAILVAEAEKEGERMASETASVTPLPAS